MDRVIDGALAARVYELENELAEYLRHRRSCIHNGTGRCTCGLALARQSFDELLKKMLRALGEIE